MKKKSNYYSPTPVYWRKIGDMFLAMIPVYLTGIATTNLTMDQKIWTMVIGATVLAGLKALTNTKSTNP